MEERSPVSEYTLFLAYSPEDAPHDRNALGNFIRKLNDIYRQRGEPVYLRLKEAEYAPEGARGADLIISLSLRHAGGQELIRSIWESQKGQKLPPILTYFRQQDTEDAAETNADFRQFLEQTTKHYWTQYSDISYVNCNILMHLIMNLEVPVEIHADSVRVGEEIVFDLDDFAALRSSPALKALYQQLQQCEEECLALMGGNDDYLHDPAYRAATEQRSALRKKKQQLSEVFFGLLQQFTQHKGQDGLTLRQQQAQEALLAGKLDAADRILDADEISLARQDADCQIRQLEAQIAGLKNQICQNIQELLTKIRILELGSDTPFETIEQLFRTAMDWEEQHDLPRTATKAYIRHLMAYDRFSAARDQAEAYLQYGQQGRCDEARAFAHGCLAHCAYHMGNTDEELPHLVRAEESFRKLKDADPQEYFSSWAQSFIQLAACRNRHGENTEATQQLYDILAELKQYEALDRQESLAAQGWAHLQLEACHRHRNWPQALQEGLDAKKIFDALDASEYCYEQIMCGLCLAGCYAALNQRSDAKKCLQALEPLVQHYLAQSPQKHLMQAVEFFDIRGRLAINYRNPSPEDLNHGQEDLQKARELLQLYREYAGDDSFHRILTREASICRGLSHIAMDTGKLDEAVKYSLKARAKLQFLVSFAPGLHIPTLADTDSVLGGLYSRLGEPALAKEAYARALSVVETHGSQIPIFSPEETAKICHHYASLIFETGDREAALSFLPFLAAQPEQAAYSVPDRCILQCALGCVYSTLEKWAEAAAAFRPVQEALDSSTVSIDVVYALEAYLGLGRALYHRKNYRESVIHLESARMTYLAYEKALSAGSLGTSAALLRLLAKVYNQLNRKADAKKAATQAKEQEELLAKRQAALRKEGSL